MNKKGWKSLTRPPPKQSRKLYVRSAERDYTLPIHSIKTEGATFYVNIYLDDTVNGTVTNTKLYDGDNNLLIQRADVVSKPAEKALLIVFQIETKEVSP